MLRKNAYLDLLIVRNSCDASPTFIDGLPVSQRGEGHGYGVKIVQRKAAQYHGDCMFHYDARKKNYFLCISYCQESVNYFIVVLKNNIQKSACVS